MQELISETLSTERRRLGDLLTEVLDDAAKAALAQLLVRDDTLSQLAALKQDAKSFGWLQMIREREKRALLEPLHRIAKALLHNLGVSQQNLLYYASLANFFLHRPRPAQPQGWIRPISICCATPGNATGSSPTTWSMRWPYHMKQLEDESSALAQKSFLAEQVRR